MVSPTTWLDLSGVLGGGLVWADRTFEHDGFQATQYLRGWSVAAQLAVNLHPASFLTLGARAELGLLRAQLGDERGPHTYAVPAMEVGFTW